MIRVKLSKSLWRPLTSWATKLPMLQKWEKRSKNYRWEAFLPQHRERIVLVGFRRDLNIHKGFTLRDISRFYPEHRPSFGELLEPVVDSKYILTPKLWEYLYNYAKSMQPRGMVLALGWSILRIRKALHAHFLPDITKTDQKFLLIVVGIWQRERLTL